MSAQPRAFLPPHCPRSDCPSHRLPAGAWRWVRFGSYFRRCEPRTIPRFRCGHCRRTFSSQTFSTTYFLKRPELLEPIFHRLLAGSGLRQITREARCAHATVMGQAARLGRHALLFLTAHRPRGPVAEPLVIDGFESFAFSQYHPLHLNLAIGADSHFCYAFTHSRLRRKGRMTDRQRERRGRLETRHGRPDPKAVELDMEAALRIAAPEAQALTVRSDEHPAYPRSLRRLRGYTVRHECTPSIEARTPGNPLFAVNLMDLLLRHHSANHKREGIAFSKRHQAVAERAALLILWRNFCKRFSENYGGDTPAMRLGLARTPLSPRRILARRLFEWRVELPEVWREYYRRAVPTPGIHRPQVHRLKLAC
jgi:transposase-like protein